MVIIKPLVRAGFKLSVLFFIFKNTLISVVSFKWAHVSISGQLPNQLSTWLAQILPELDGFVCHSLCWTVHLTNCNNCLGVLEWMLTAQAFYELRYIIIIN